MNLYIWNIQIEELIRKGHLKKFVRPEKIEKPKEARLNRVSVQKHINVIIGGPTLSDKSNNKSKSYADTLLFA